MSKVSNSLTSFLRKTGTGFCNTPPNSHDTASQTLPYDLTVGIDYLTLVYKYDSLEVFGKQTEFLLDWIGDLADYVDKGAKAHGRAFQSHYKTLKGIEVYWNIMDTGEVDVMYCIGGQPLSSCEPRDLARALLYLERWFIRCNRIDIAVDDSSGNIKALRSKILSSYLEDLHSGFRVAKVVTEYKKKELPAGTLYLGSRKAAAMYCRIYDKFDYHKDTKEVSKEYCRFEVESKGFRANQLFRLYFKQLLQASIDSVWDFRKMFTRVFSAAIINLNFYSERKSKNLSRNPVAGWWSEFLLAIDYEKIRLAKLVRVTSLDKTLEWLKRSVAPSLAMVKRCLGGMYPHWITELLKGGEERLNTLHELLIELYKRPELKEYLASVLV